jgi:cyclic dehypoxanthinyl futalosine synthase
MQDTIRQKVTTGQRIELEEAAWLAKHAEDALLRELSNTVRDRFHPDGEASWLMMSIINYTNICVARCDYCSFYRLPGREGGYLLSLPQVCARIDALRALGGTLVSFNGGFHPKLKIDHYAELFEEVHARYPDMTFFEMTVAEFMYSCKVSRLSYAEGARRLADAGTQWVTGGGAEVLEEGFRMRHSPLKYTVTDYYNAQRAILDAGMGSTATMVIGFDETLGERLAHLETLRAFQDSVACALPSFLCWTYKPENNALGGEEIDTPSYLRWMAVCRIYLDNIVHIRTSVLTRNEDAFKALLYGANDFDLPTEDEVTQTAGATINQNFDDVLATAEELGLTLRHRPPFSLREPFPARASLVRSQE